MSLEPRRLRSRYHAPAARPGGAGGSLPAGPGRDRRSSGPPSRGTRPHRSRAALDSLARGAPRGGAAAVRRPRVRRRGGRPGRLSPRQSAAGAAAARLRLFIALNLPAAVRQALWQTVAPVRDRGLPVKWVRPDGIHLTLKFLGDVVEEQRSEEHTSELQSQSNLVCRLLLEKKKEVQSDFVLLRHAQVIRYLGRTRRVSSQGR